jgi:ribosome-binding protein aMBF1 (putative translation factor)
MSVRMKRHHTDDSVAIVVRGKLEEKFVIPDKSIAELVIFIKKLQAGTLSEDERDSIPADEVFAELYEKHGKVGATLRGLRFREHLTQKVLAEKLGIKQGHVSEMEWGRRPIGKKMAHKLAKLFNISYRVFL